MNILHWNYFEVGPLTSLNTSCHDRSYQQGLEQGKWCWQDLSQKYYLSFILKISCHFNLVDYSDSTFTLLLVFLTPRDWLAASGEHSRTRLSQMQRDPARPGFFADSHHGLHQLNKPPAKPAAPAVKNGFFSTLIWVFLWFGCTSSHMLRGHSADP